MSVGVMIHIEGACPLSDTSQSWTRVGGGRPSGYRDVMVWSPCIPCSSFEKMTLPCPKHSELQGT